MKPIRIFLIENGADSVLQLWFAAKKKENQPPWVEVRGDINKYNPSSLFHKIHDIKRINISELHAGRATDLLPEWEGYNIAYKVLK